MREAGCRLIQNLGDSEVGAIGSFRRAVDAVGSWSPFTEVTAVRDLGVLELGVRRLWYSQGMERTSSTSIKQRWMASMISSTILYLAGSSCWRVGDNLCTKGAQ